MMPTIKVACSSNFKTGDKNVKHEANEPISSSNSNYFTFSFREPRFLVYTPPDSKRFDAILKMCEWRLGKT